MTTIAAAARAAEPSAATNAVSEVVVTAQKREQDIKSVPIAITALSGAILRTQHITSFDDLSRVAPGVAFDTSAEPGTTNISIRGVSSQAGSATVGLYIDDVSITTKNFFYEGAIDPNLPDLDRVEVLRGPQGTLYGDSSEGGTIRYITRPPNMHSFSGEITLDTSNTEHGGENYSGSLVVNLPIIADKVAVRASASSDEESGWIDHYAQNLATDNSVLGAGQLLQKGVNTTRTDALHIIAKITPGWGLTITPAFFYQHQYASDSSAFYVQTPGLGLYGQDKLVGEPDFDDVSLASLNIQKEFSFATLTSITGLLHRQTERQEDGTFFNSASFVALITTTPGVVLPTPNVPLTQALNTLADLPSAVHLDTHYKQFTQELRLASPDLGPDEPLHWQVGLYFAQQSVQNTDFQQIEGINSTFQSLFGMPMEQVPSIESTFAPDPNTVLFPDNIDESDSRAYKETQYAGFGQIDYNLTPQWHFSLGGRYSDAAEHFISIETGFYQIGNLGFTGVPAGVPFGGPYTQKAESKSFTPKASVSYDVNPNETVYVSAGQGFRLGGATGPIVFGPTSVCNADFIQIHQTSQPTKFGPDSLWTYELGSKGRYLDGRITVNGAAYYTDWRNIQQQIYLPDCGYYFTQNVGDATIYGGEFEATFKITDDLKLTANGMVQSATVTRSVNPISVPQGSNLIDVPYGTFTSSLIYNKTISDQLRLSAMVDYELTGRSNGSYQRFTNTVFLGSLANLNFNNPAYSVVNASITLSTRKLDLTLYVKNLLDDQTIIQSPEINTVFQGYTVKPRVVGVQLRGYF